MDILTKTQIWTPIGLDGSEETAAAVVNALVQIGKNRPVRHYFKPSDGVDKVMRDVVIASESRISLEVMMTTRYLVTIFIPDTSSHDEMEKVFADLAKARQYADDYRDVVYFVLVTLWSSTSQLTMGGIASFCNDRPGGNVILVTTPAVLVHLPGYYENWLRSASDTSS
jgi:hypothetical protein